MITTFNFEKYLSWSCSYEYLDQLPSSVELASLHNNRKQHVEVAFNLHKPPFTPRNVKDGEHKE